MIFKEQSNFLDKISEWGFITNPLSQKVLGINEIQEHHEKIELL